MRIEGNGTGRLSEDAVKAAAEAARQSAAEAARKAADAARLAEAEAIRQAASRHAANKHTGRLHLEALHMDLGEVPWEKADTAIAAIATGVAALTASAGYKGLKDSLSVKKKTEDIRETVAKLRDIAAGGKGEVKGGGGILSRGNLGQTLGKIDKSMKVVGGVQSALNLRHSIAALQDGVTVQEAIQVSRDVLGTIRGVDAVGRLAGKNMFGKFNPALAVAGASADIAARSQKLATSWSRMSPKDRIANIASIGASTADIIGATTPPPVKFAAMGVSAGLSLVALGAENIERIEVAAVAVEHAVEKAADMVAHWAKQLGRLSAGGGKRPNGGE